MKDAKVQLQMVKKELNELLCEYNSLLELYNAQVQYTEYLMEKFGCNGIHMEDENVA